MKNLWFRQDMWLVHCYIYKRIQNQIWLYRNNLYYRLPFLLAMLNQEADLICVPMKIYTYFYKIHFVLDRIRNSILIPSGQKSAWTGECRINVLEKQAPYFPCWSLLRLSPVSLVCRANGGQWGGRLTGYAFTLINFFQMYCTHFDK